MGEPAESVESGAAFLFSRIASRVLNPLYLTPLAILAISMHETTDWASGLRWFALYVAFSTVIPLADLAVRRRTGRISDWHISRREERLAPLIFSLAYASAGTLTMLLLKAPRALSACMVTGLATGITALLITLGWKISLHTMGNALLAALLFMVLRPGWGSPLTWLLCLLVAITGASRVFLKQHTPWQVLAGAAVGVGVGYSVFLAFGLA
jgi:membrane-associated phospholipid phosphatase